MVQQNNFILSIINQLITLTIVLASFSMLGCKNTAAPSVSGSQGSASLLLFQKTSCFGTCPSYEALIHTDGTVRFIGRRYVPVTDTLTFQLSDVELQELQTDIADLNYKSLQDLYKTKWTDMPATHLYFYEAGQEVKHIKHEEGGPEKLVKFNEKVHQLLWKYVATPNK